jgi:pimeloyl-ACP methyl ester carboxylesterase
VSTPPHLTLPASAKAYQIHTDRGAFAIHDSLPPGGVDRLGTALLVPGYTGSKEDFLTVLGPLAERGHRVVAIDQRGQYESPGPEDIAAYDLDTLARDMLAVAEALGDGPVHLVGHSFGGFVTRGAALLAPDQVRSLVLLDTGPGAVQGAERERLRLLLAALEEYDLPAIWQVMSSMAENRGEYDGVPPDVLAFLRMRFLSSTKAGMIAMGRHLLDPPDRLGQLAASAVPRLVAYGDGEYVWPEAEQGVLAERLDARIAVIRGAAHSPAVERPEQTVAVLAEFWSGTENKITGIR